MNPTYVGYRPNLDAPSERIRKLPIVRGYPVPWFVAWINVPSGESQGVKAVPEFRAMDIQKFAQAINQKLCWVCGENLGRFMTFVAGPMCGINRTSAEPPSHIDCAQWSVRNCPFLSDPEFDRRELGMEDSVSPAGHMIRRNPGVSLLWTCREYTLFDDGRGGALLHLGDPASIEWWCRKRKATRAEVEESIRTGLPTLEKLADEQEGAMEELAAMVRAFRKHLPKE